MTADRFSWHTVDIGSLLPRGWATEVHRVSMACAQAHALHGQHVTSREGGEVDHILVETVSGSDVDHYLPWLVNLYHGPLQELAARLSGQTLHGAQDPRIKINVNVQRAGRRYECHVDTNPVEALLFATDHPQGAGGELVVANDPAARSVAEVEADCSVLYPVAGHLVVFDGRRHPHFVRPLVDPSSIRLVVAMNYYTDGMPESGRPADLTAYLGGLQPSDRAAT